MIAHLFFPFTPPNLGLPSAPAAPLLPFSPFLPLSPFSPPLFFAPSFAPSGDVAFDRRPLRVCRPWDLVDGIGLGLWWWLWWLWWWLWLWLLWLCESSVVGEPMLFVGTFRSQPFLVWLMWRGGKTVGTYLSSYH